MNQSGSSRASPSDSRRSRYKTKVKLEPNLLVGPRHRDASNDISKLPDILHDNNIPGPRLIRLDKASEEFSATVGKGGQSIVQAPSKPFSDRLLNFGEGSKSEENVRRSTNFWRRCVVKQLRHRRPGQSHLGQVEFALNELNILYNNKFKSSNVVRLEGWGFAWMPWWSDPPLPDYPY
ncbi:hypothetical protein PEX1_033740 [Penicillium expansum]|nr:hypothetical protein PEX1_033740 [Penicillium expansum]